MSLLPPDTEEIKGAWTIVDGQRTKDENWLLIERYLAEECHHIASGTYAEGYVENTEERFWWVRYEDRQKREGPPTLERSYPETDNGRAKRLAFYAKALKRWEAKLLAELDDSDRAQPSPELQALMQKVIYEDVRTYWSQNLDTFDPRFNALMAELFPSG